MQYPIVYLVLKRMRAPLILLIMAYTVSTAGMAIIPGVDGDGNPVHLTIFQSFYFISYVATTIGFGEIPYEFTDVQRLWVVFCIYLTVISWLVAIGNIISLLQDPALQNAWKKERFIKQTKNINEPFFIICGYGETGEMLVDNLTERGFQCVVIDNDADRINLLDLNSSIYNVPYILEDVSKVETLKIAGLENENCRAVLAVTRNEKVNVKVAVATKLLRSSVKVVCRVNTKEAMANAKSFDTDFVINSNSIYAENFSRSFRTPSIQQMTASLLRRSGREYIRQVTPPKGHWIVCGYKGLGEEMARFLEYEGMDVTIVSDDPHLTIPHVHGRGTEAVTLRAAGIEKSVGLIATTGDDTDNLSVVMTARHLKPNLFLAARQNHERNGMLFKSADIDSVMESARLMMWSIMPLITQSKMSLFLRLARHQDEKWGQEVISRLMEVSETVPATYLLKINEEKTPAIIPHLETGNILRLQDIFVKDKDYPEKPVALPLMLIRDGKNELLPKLSTGIKKGDIFLIASTEETKAQVLYTTSHDQDFHYIIHGEEKPVSIVAHKVRQKYLEYKLAKRYQRKVKQEQARKAILEKQQEQESREQTNQRTTEE